MRRLILALGLACAACLGARADEDKKEEKKESFADIAKEAIGKFRAEKDEKKQHEILKEAFPRFLGYAEKNPKEKDALGALNLAFQVVAMTKDAKLGEQAVALVKKGFMENKAVAGLLPSIATAGKPGMALAREFREKGDEKTKKQATMAILSAIENVLLDADAAETKALTKEHDELRKVAVEEYKMKDLFVGSKMLDLKSENLDGKEEKLSQYKGKVVVLDIWATWCPPCRDMIPHERELVERLKGKPFALISISGDESPGIVKAFLKDEPMPWVHWYEGPRGRMLADWKVDHFPAIYVLDKKGNIRYTEVRYEEMDQAVDALLAE